MGIESNKEAYEMMQNALRSIENKIREAYNKGYYTGMKEGVNQATQKLGDWVFDGIKERAERAVTCIYVPAGEWLSGNDYDIQMKGDGDPWFFKITPAIRSGEIRSEDSEDDRG